MYLEALVDGLIGSVSTLDFSVAQVGNQLASSNLKCQLIVFVNRLFLLINNRHLERSLWDTL